MGAQGRGPQGRAVGQDGQMMRPPSRGRPGELKPGEETSGRFDSPEEDPLAEGRPQRRVCSVSNPKWITTSQLCVSLAQHITQSIACDLHMTQALSLLSFELL